MEPTTAINRTKMKRQGGEMKEKKEEGAVQLHRTIGLLSAVSFIIGTVVGSGIFIAPKGVLMNSGSVGLSLLVWALCGLLSTFGKRAAASSYLCTTFKMSTFDHFYAVNSDSDRVGKPTMQSSIETQHLNKNNICVESNQTCVTK